MSLIDQTCRDSSAQSWYHSGAKMQVSSVGVWNRCSMSLLLYANLACLHLDKIPPAALTDVCIIEPQLRLAGM
jgi:hypothetical protein